MASQHKPKDRRLQFMARTGLPAAAIVLFALVFRLTWLSAHYASEGQSAYARGDYEQALHAYTWCIRQHYPGNPYTREAIENTLALAERNHAQQQPHDAHHTLQQLQASLYAIRSFYQPYLNQLRTVQQQLAAFKPDRQSH